jgi:hypothetical protein
MQAGRLLAKHPTKKFGDRLVIAVLLVKQVSSAARFDCDRPSGSDILDWSFTRLWSYPRSPTTAGILQRSPGSVGFWRVAQNGRKRSSASLWSLRKLNPLEYRYTIPETGSGVRVALSAPGDLKIRAFCHTHPKSDETGDFGSDDLDSFKKAIKDDRLSGVAFYLMNRYKEVRIAQSVEQFLRGRSLDFKP